MSSLPRCNHQTVSEIWSKCKMRRLARGATIYILAKIETSYILDKNVTNLTQTHYFIQCTVNAFSP